MKVIEVGVFLMPGRNPLVKSSYAAYTMWFNPTWKHCCLHKIEAERGSEAKAKAIREHIDHCQPVKLQGEEIFEVSQ